MNVKNASNQSGGWWDRAKATAGKAAVRATRTAAQAALAVLGTDAVTALDADLLQVASVSGMAAALSLLQAVAFGLPEAGNP